MFWLLWPGYTGTHPYGLSTLDRPWPWPLPKPSPYPSFYLQCRPDYCFLFQLVSLDYNIIVGVVSLLISLFGSSKFKLSLRHGIYFGTLLPNQTFLLSSIYIRRKYWIREKFRLTVSMDFHVLRCPEHDLTIFRKCLSLGRSVCM